MDLSKLPRLSNSENPQPAAPPPVAVQPAQPLSRPVPDYAQSDPAGFKAEAWISLAVGIILLLMFPRFPQWASSKLFHTHFNEYVLPDGVTVVPYTQVHDIWPDLGCTLFSVALIAEAIGLVMYRNRIVLWATLLIGVVGTGYNLIYLVQSFNQYGFALVSALAVAFGMYLLVMHWQLIVSNRQQKN